MDQLYTTRCQRGDYNTREGKWITNVVTAVDKYSEGGSDQSFYPVSEEQAMTENCYIPRVSNNSNRTWETKIIPSQIWTNR